MKLIIKITSLLLIVSASALTQDLDDISYIDNKNHNL